MATPSIKSIIDNPLLFCSFLNIVNKQGKNVRLTLNGEQKKIISEAKSGHDLVIQALAGTGKTTTLKLLAESLFDKRGTYIAFNKAIVDEAASKFPENVRCKTAHSLAYGAIGYKYKDSTRHAGRNGCRRPRWEPADTGGGHR